MDRKFKKKHNFITLITKDKWAKECQEQVRGPDGPSIICTKIIAFKMTSAGLPLSAF